MRSAVLLICMIGCVEYDFADPKPLVAAGDGAIAVDPAAVSRVLCTGGIEVLTVENVGSGVLSVTDVVLEGDGWWFDPVPPFVLGVGDTLELELERGAGEASLHLFSDDPAVPELVVPLIGLPNESPRVALLYPGPDGVLPPGAETALWARVSDDHDPPETLAISWSSDVDGAIGNLPALPSGEVAQPWAIADRSEGDHVLTVTATDHCGETAEASVGTCQQGGYVEGSIDHSTWAFMGDARWDTTNDWLEVTPVITNSVGAAFQTQQAVRGDDVEIAFSFYASGGSGADGLSVTAIDLDRMTSYVGATGGGIGYGGYDLSSALPGWSVEVDTWFNGGQDPTSEDHVAFSFDGAFHAPQMWAAVPDMEDGQWHEMSVRVQAPHVTVTLDGVVYIDHDFAGYYDFPAHVGFTAATGSATNFHLIDALEVTQLVCEEPDRQP